MDLELNSPDQKNPLAAIRRVGVVGAGVMGSGIAQWLAARGCEVVLRDVQPAALDRARSVMDGLFDEAVRRGKLTGPEAAAARGRLTTTTTWEGFEACDLVVEAIVEDVATKRHAFSEIANVVHEDTVIASNTSALPIEEIAGHVARPDRVCGLHFFNPVSRMALVEVVLGRETSPATCERVLRLMRDVGKQAVVCRSSPGFLVTRVLFFYLNAAVHRWETGESTLEIDGALRDFGWPMGPLRLIDEVGLDVTDFIFGELEHYFPGRFFRSKACGELLRAGMAGRKNGAGRGFYRYDRGGEVVNDGETRAVTANSPTRAEGAEIGRADCVTELMRVMVNEAERCLDEAVVASASDVDLALRLGAGFPAARGGLLAWARSQNRS